MSDVSAAEALRRVVTGGFERVLVPAGFARPRRKLTWVRSQRDVHHVVSVLRRSGRFTVQWGVHSPEAVPILWGGAPDVSDVGQSVLSGTPASIRYPAPGGDFRLDDGIKEGDVEALIINIRRDMELVSARLTAFDTRHDVRSYLLENRAEKDPRDFVIPMHLPLKLLYAATLALIDEDPDACALLAEIDHTTGLRFSDDARMLRLRAAAAPLCGERRVATHPADA